MRDTYFSLDFDKAKPKDPKECKMKDQNGNLIEAPKFDPVQPFFDLLDNGDLTAIGGIYRGWVNSATGQFISGTPDPQITATQCIIVYIGGTAYRICR